MTFLRKLLIPAMLCAAALPAWADDDDDRRGRGRGHERREFKEEYWDGNCKVKRKLEKNGEYKEERECKGPKRGHYQPAPVYHPAPVYAPGPVIIEPGITVHGTVRLP